MHVPGWLYLHHHLHYVPGERTFNATMVFVVCSACQGICVGFVNRRLLGKLVYQWESYLLVQLASQSFLVCPTGPVVPGRSSDPLCILFPLFSSPLVDPFEFGLCPVSPPHSPSSIFFPRLSLSFCPPHQLLSLHTLPIALFSWLLPTFSSVVPSTDALSFSRD